MWTCKNCETNNEDANSCCDVCGLKKSTKTKPLIPAEKKDEINLGFFDNLSVIFGVIVVCVIISIFITSFFN